MKKNKLFLAIATMILMAGCEKFNFDGKDGADGTKIISGAGIPTVIQGNEGDLFFDTVGAVMWGPKIGTSWGSGRALSGKTMMSGSGAPDNGMGVDGDFYVDISSMTMFGPKSGGTWGTGTILKGATGTANVIYSAWVTSPTASKDTSVDGTCLRVRHFTAPSLTSTIKDNCAIITYMRVGSIGPYLLPYVSDAGGATNQVNCMYALKKITVYRHTYNTCRFTSGVAESYPGQPVMVNLPQSLEYRYIIIPGAIPEGPKPEEGSTMGNDKIVQMPNGQVVDFSKKSYLETCALLGIQP